MESMPSEAHLTALGPFDEDPTSVGSTATDCSAIVSEHNDDDPAGVPSSIVGAIFFFFILSFFFFFFFFSSFLCFCPSPDFH